MSAATLELVKGDLPPDVDANVAVAQAAMDPAPPPGLARGALPPDVEAAVAVAQSARTLELVKGELPPDVDANVAVAQSVLTGWLSLSLKDGGYRDAPDPAPLPETVEAGAGAAAVPLDNQRLFAIVREVAVDHSGDDLHAAVSLDEEYRTPGHPAYGTRHFGLGFGLVLFTQESGQLGSVLQLMQRRNPEGFADAFGGEADALLAVTNAPDAAGRLAPVGGAVLWAPTWAERFRAAAERPECQAAQNEQAIEGQLRPALETFLDLGLDTDRALALAYDAVVSRGVGGGLRWVVESCGPLRTQAQRDHALATLGPGSVAAFQASAGLGVDGVFGPATHARLVARLRAQGAIPLPTAPELVRRLVAAATGAARVRLERLAASPALADVACRVE